MSNRRVLIVIGNYKNGGIARRATRIANGLAEKGRYVDIIVTKESIGNGFFKLHKNVRVIELNKCNEQNTNISALINIWKTKIEIKASKFFSSIKLFKRFFEHSGYSSSKKNKNMRLRYLLSSYNKPIIIAFGLDYVIDTYYASTGMKKNIIYASKASAEHEIISINKEEAVRVLNRIDYSVCQTQNAVNYFSKLGAENLSVIHNPLKMETKAYCGAREKRIVNFCRYSREKKIEILIEAFADFVKEYPDYNASIYGSTNLSGEEEYKNELQSMIDKLGLGDKFFLEDARKDIHEVVRKAGMFVSTSDNEGLSNSMIEAMALGIPCICTDCDGGGARELIKNEINGLLIPKNDAESLLLAMKRFAENPDFANACAEQGARIRDELKTEKIAGEWLKIIEDYCS